MAIIPELMRVNKPSKTVEKMLKKIDSRFHSARRLYPELILGSKDCNRIGKQVYRLQHTKRIHIACVTSMCLLGFGDALGHLSAKRKIAVEGCLSAVNSLHKYFDRNLNLNAEYIKAAQLMGEY